MMGDQMALFRKFRYSPRPPAYLEKPNHDGSVMESALSPKLWDICQQAIPFDIQLACDVTKADDGKRLKFDAPLKLPYPKTWMEFRSPANKRPWGFLLQEGEFGRDIHDTLTPEKWVGERGGAASIYALMDDGSIMLCPYAAVWQDANTEDTLSLVDHTAEPQEPSPEDARLVLSRFHIAATALGLINCRNVTTREHKIGLRRTGVEKRRGLPAQFIRYNTIVLPGGGTESDGKGGHRATALHRVRGHFKTFTADKPLMGKYTGTYWWGWQLRGNPDLGVVISDYKLEATPASKMSAKSTHLV